MGRGGIFNGMEQAFAIFQKKVRKKKMKKEETPASTAGERHVGFEESICQWRWRIEKRWSLLLCNSIPLVRTLHHATAGCLIIQPVRVFTMRV